MSKPVPLLILLLTALAGCGPLAGLLSSTDPAVAETTVDAAAQLPDADTARPGGSAHGLGSAGLRPDQLDRTSDAERLAALVPATAPTPALGETLAALGSPVEPGLWLRTGLVDTVTQGRVELVEGAGSLRVELRPSGATAGSGSQMSLAAFSTLNLPLTQLVLLRVYAY